MAAKDLIEIREKLKNSDALISIFDDYGIAIDEIDIVPICFDEELDCSAKTIHGIIYINSKFIDDTGNVEHYIAHELTHYLQQTTGSGTSNKKDYIKNKDEIEGFSVQVEYMKENDKDPKEYIEKVLDHNEVDSEKEREKFMKKVMSNIRAQQLNYFSKMNKFAQNLGELDSDSDIYTTTKIYKTVDEPFNTGDEVSDVLESPGNSRSLIVRKDDVKIEGDKLIYVGQPAPGTKA